MPIKPSTRLYHCQLCHRQVMICQPCDNGQRYCAGQCRRAARKNSLKRANLKYQKSVKGRFNNADRQRRFRERKKQADKIVTDQASPSIAACDLLSVEPGVFKNRQKAASKACQTVCHFCGGEAGSFFRTGFLKKRTVYPYIAKLTVNQGEPIDDY